EMTEVSLSHLFRYLAGGEQCCYLARQSLRSKNKEGTWALLWARERLLVKMRIPVADEPSDPVLYIPVGDLAAIQRLQVHARMTHGCRKDERIARASVRVSTDIIGVIGSRSRRFWAMYSAWRTSSARCKAMDKERCSCCITHVVFLGVLLGS